MEFLDKIKSFADENGIFDGRTLIVGLSGGPDSVALLLILKKITDCPIHAVHVNHMLREEADDDESFVRELCEKNDVPCTFFSFDVKKKAQELKRSLEDTGRILRYEAFDEVSKELFGEEYLSKTAICLAHHKDDLSETMLMNLFRGSGLDGLVTPKANSGRVVRPLLCVSKSEILEFLSSLGQDYCQDKTNLEEICTRNIWRNKIIPSLSEAAVKDPAEALFETYNLLKDDCDFMSEFTMKIWDECFDRKSLTLDIKALEGNHPAIASRLVRMLWKETFGNLTDFTKIHVDAVLGLSTDNGPSGRTLDLPFKRNAFVVRDRLGFCSREDIDEGFLRAVSTFGIIGAVGMEPLSLDDVRNTTILPKSHITIKAEIVENIDLIRYNTNSWFCPFFSDISVDDLRFGRLGEDITFKRAGTEITSKVTKILSDLKVPSKVRGEVFGVYMDDKALWIPGVGHAIGFTDEISKERFLNSLGSKGMPDKYLAVHLTEV